MLLCVTFLYLFPIHNLPQFIQVRSVKFFFLQQLIPQLA